MSIRKTHKTRAKCLREIDADSDAMVQFQRWFEESKQDDLPEWVEANAMTLSTADKSGHVSSRVVLLRDIEEGKLCFYTSYDSPKGQQLEANPHVSLCFFWPHQQRQVRIEGRVSRTDRNASEQSFRRRERASQLAVHLARQSAEVENQQVLEQRMQQVADRYADRDVPCPETWGGYQVEPTRFEFWQGRDDRLHDRICYERDGKHWKQTRLAP